MNFIAARPSCAIRGFPGPDKEVHGALVVKEQWGWGAGRDDYRREVGFIWIANWVTIRIYKDLRETTLFTLPNLLRISSIALPRSVRVSGRSSLYTCAFIALAVHWPEVPNFSLAYRLPISHLLRFLAYRYSYLLPNFNLAYRFGRIYQFPTSSAFRLHQKRRRRRPMCVKFLPKRRSTHVSLLFFPSQLPT